LVCLNSSKVEQLWYYIAFNYSYLHERIEQTAMSLESCEKDYSTNIY